ncbi:MAG: aminopeptidase [Clostridiales bacterium]|nr:aminopeptidase [Clostridiales bacterium]
MSFNDKLREYASLTARNGVNVTKGKYVLLRCAIEAAEFGRMVEEECFKLGAKDVIVIYEDQRASRIRLDYADISEFENVPEWRAEQRNYYAREGCVCINIISEDPEIFAGAPSEKLMANSLAAHKAFKEFYDVMDKGGLRWTIVAYPNEAWATRVFPGLTPAKAVNKLWAAIFKTVRITRGDTFKKWEQHDRLLKRRAEKLNRERFTSLHYTNSLGTDFTVGLAEGHIWKGGSERCADGVDYFPNMPTEEIFTMPDCRRADGKVYSTLPLSYQGELIDNFWLEFKDGAVVGYGAKSGEHALKRLLDTDEGSKRLGEVALIPYDSPISNLGILFYNTLFDENASCHLALGECYPDTVENGAELSEEELAALGGNKSANHVDFMIGTPDLEITGIKADGSEIQIFSNGGFVI